MSNFDLQTYWKNEQAEHEATTKQTFETLQDSFEHILDVCTKSIQNGGKLIFFGNGGSASDAQHLATELTIRFINDRAPIAAVALTTDTSALTAAGNDYGFDFIFSRQLEAIGKPEDIAIGISTSGNSANVIKALESAQKIGITTVGMGGKDGGKMQDLCDHTLIVPSNTTARIQEMHITLGHMLCGGLEQALGLA